MTSDFQRYAQLVDQEQLKIFLNHYQIELNSQQYDNTISSYY